MIPPVSNSLQGLIKTHGRFIAKERTIMTKKIVLIVMTMALLLCSCTKQAPEQKVDGTE